MSATAIPEARRRALRGPDARVPTALLVSDTVADHAQKDHDRVALLERGGVGTTYGRLHDLTGRLISLLTGHGCGPGGRVAVAGTRSADTVAAFLALERIGAVYVPVDTGWPEQRLRQVLGQTDCSFVLLTAGEGGADAGGLNSALALAAAGSGAKLLTTADAARQKPAWEREPERQGADREPRYIVHTSGSTGRPKGAIVEHGAMVNHLWHMVEALGIRRDDVVAFSAPPVHVVAIWQMLAPLLAGATVAVVPQGAESFPRPLLRALRQDRVTVLQLVPTMMNLVADELSRYDPATWLPGLRWLISTGEELSPLLAGRILELLPDTRLMNAYGMSECSDDVAQHVVRAEDLRSPRLPVGLPITNAVLHVLVEDGLAWRPAHHGETGELFVGGLPVGAGYAGAAQGQSAAFFHDTIDPDSPNRRLYRTGDLVRIENGLLYCLGRTDRQIKIRGVRVELDEVERALEQHPDVSQCAVTADAARAVVELTAHVVVDGGTTVQELYAFLQERLPKTMLPQHWENVMSLPVTRSGKVDYRALGSRPSLGR
ncbi:amino acid adenylation domain-containing protein [Streptomyces sp. BK205]|nr:amino acid adenylation domain-containing protein [Streptomyces sp. BK205]